MINLVNKGGNMNKKIIGVVAIAVVALSFAFKGPEDNMDIVAGASALPLTDKIYIKDSEVSSRYFLTINGVNKFIGYDAKHIVNENKYIIMRVNGIGVDKKWFTSDDRVNKYYIITHDKGKMISKFEYSENVKKGIPHFSGEDKVSKGTKVVEYNQDNKLLKELVYKGDKVVGEGRYIYNSSGNLVSRIEVDLDGKLKSESKYTDESKGGIKIVRRTDYKSDGSVRRWRDFYHDKNNKKEKLIKYDSLGRTVAVEIFDSNKRIFN